MMMIFNLSVIPIRWLLTIDSEMTSLLFRSLAEDLLVNSAAMGDGDSCSAIGLFIFFVLSES